MIRNILTLYETGKEKQEKKEIREKKINNRLIKDIRNSHRYQDTF